MTSFQTTWLILLVVLFVAFLLLGIWINKRPLGILIDARCRMSLSRLQVVLWSWLLISAFLAVAIAFKTMNIEMDPQIWALLGISVGSAAGSVIVKGTQTGKEPAASVPQTQRNMERQGLLATNANSKDAALDNLFTGEQLGDHAHVDISKVQMFFFSIATVLGYAMILWTFDFDENNKDGVINFPLLSTSLVTLLGISHVGYLTVKAAPKTPTS